MQKKNYVKVLGLVLAVLPALVWADVQGFEPLPIVKPVDGFYPFTGVQFGQKLWSLMGLPSEQLTAAKVGEVLGVSLAAKHAVSRNGDLDQVASVGHIGPDDMFPVEFVTMLQKSAFTRVSHFHVDVPMFRVCVPFGDAQEAALVQQGFLATGASPGGNGTPAFHAYRRAADHAELRVLVDPVDKCVRDVDEVVSVVEGAGK